MVTRSRVPYGTIVALVLICDRFHGSKVSWFTCPTTTTTTTCVCSCVPAVRHLGRGHNGLKSTIASVHSPDFWRVRIGIGRPESRASGVVSDYVLGNFEEDELAEMRSDVLPRAAHMMRDLVEELVHPDRPANHRQG